MDNTTKEQREAWEQVAFYRGVKEILKLAREEVKGRDLRYQQEFLDLLEEMKDDYLGDGNENV